MKEHSKSILDIHNEIVKFTETTIETRHASFDFCYGYFQTRRHYLSKYMEDSCMHLWSYLASWGMLRGSSELLKKSPAALKGLIYYIEKCPDKIWDLDVDNYDQSVNLLIDTYNSIKHELEKTIKRPSCTLVTKIMLGVFGNIPAFDTNFTDTFRKEFKGDTNCGFWTVNEQAIRDIATFYNANKVVFDNINILVIDFDGNKTSLKYKKAKLIDMYGFSVNK